MSRKFVFVDKNGNSYSKWEKATLKPFLTESRIKGNNGKEAQKLTVKLYGKGVIAKREGIAGSENTQYFIRKEGQLIYGKLDFLNGAFGLIPSALDGFESTLDSPSFDISGIDPKFLLELISRKEFYLKNGRKANGSRIAKRIHPEDFLAMPILIPSLAEQQKIAEFFSALDERIALTADKVKLLKEQKTGYLQKIFAREIAFTDDNGDKYPEWEQKKLGDVLESCQNGTSITQNLYQKGYPVTRIETISSGKINMSKVGYVETDVSLERHLLKSEDILFSNINSIEHIGKTAIVPDNLPTIYHGMNLLLLRTNSSNSGKYLFVYLNSQTARSHFRMVANKAVNQASINQTELAKTVIPTPSLPEQEKIAEFFSALDKQIELTENKLTLLKEQKKGYLQGIFG